MSSTWSNTGLLTDGPNSQSRLPTELYILIIDLLLTAVRYPYLNCTPKLYPQYQLLFQNVDNVPRIPMFDDWKRIRSVCRGWKHIAGTVPYIITNHCFSRPLGIPLDASNVFIHSSTSMFAATNLLATPPNIRRNSLTMLAFGHRHITGFILTEYILRNVVTFPNLQCLCIPSTNGQRNFWELIDTALPKLVSLTITEDAYGVPGHYILKNIEILELSRWYNFTLSCPSIRHFYADNSSDRLVSLFISMHTHQLKSLLLPPDMASVVMKFPNLELPGIPNVETAGTVPFEATQDLSQDHPLRNIRIYAKRHPLEPLSILSELIFYPGVQFLHIRRQDVQHGRMDALKALFEERGVQVIEIFDGDALENISVTPNSIPRIQHIQYPISAIVSCRHLSPYE